jgi:hypothetical protein
MDDEKIKQTMGSRFKDARPVVDDFQPSKPKMPERPTNKRKDLGDPTPAPFPVIPQDQVSKYMEEKAKPEEPFAGNQTRKFDPELNEYALREIAKERGITVEELLKTKGKKLEQKVEPVEKTPASEPKALEEGSNLTEEELLEIELKELELKKRKLELQRKAEKEAAQQQQSQPQAAATPKTFKKEVNPVLKKMREKLSLERVKPVEVIVEDVGFELLPPPSSVYPWVLNKIQEVAGQTEAVKMMLKLCTAATGIVRVEKMPIAEVLELVPEGSVKDPLNPPTEVRILTAQTLIEMYQGEPSLDNLFPFNPNLVEKIYTAFEVSFKDLGLKSSFDPKQRKFTCPVDDCKEVYDLAVEKGVPVFCQIHGIPMDDRGLTSEVEALPLQ